MIVNIRVAFEHAATLRETANKNRRSDVIVCQPTRLPRLTVFPRHYFSISDPTVRPSSLKTAGEDSRLLSPEKSYRKAGNTSEFVQRIRE